jgi:5-oxopent-3-ene-1,2,5-tricarboxylate decarboxylase/2-hydroxyhepta-2,4-diene-1,7-dioate isomerase
MKRARIAWQGAIHQAEVLEDGARLRLRDGREAEAAQVVFLPPTEPRVIVALGLNYADRAAELAFKAPTEPLVFLKGPNSLAGHGAAVHMPGDARHMHYECELTVVIGRTARRVAREDAYAVIGGYTIANDYAIRDYLENYHRPNLRVKSRDGLTPVGPWIVDRDDIADPMNLRLQTSVNGVLTQEGRTADMIFDIPALIAWLTGFMTLEPGDLILTGTPPGVMELKPGDEIVTSIEGIGALRSIVAGDADFGLTGAAR